MLRIRIDSPKKHETRQPGALAAGAYIDTKTKRSNYFRREHTDSGKQQQEAPVWLCSGIRDL
jgi:hypothetical protein